MRASPRFFVLGSNSFSGATFADHLASLGHDVLAASRSAEPHPAFLPYKWQTRPGRVRFSVIDINHDLDALDALLRREQPTHVVNLLPRAWSAESWGNPDHWMMTNVVSTVRLHERLRRMDWLERYVHVTTPEVYGRTEGWVKEDAPFAPSTPYAVSRAAADMSLVTYFAHVRLSGAVHPRGERLRPRPASLPHHPAHDPLGAHRPHAALCTAAARRSAPSSTCATSPRRRSPSRPGETWARPTTSPPRQPSRSANWS